MDLNDKIGIVEERLRDKKVAIGFSGGADSTLIAYLASKVAKDTLAITIDNHLLPSGFIEHTKKMASDFGIKHEIIDIDFWKSENFLKNSPSRCFSCRSLMYGQIEKLAIENDYDYICDGNNISDLVLDRPGILVTYSKGFNTPFIEAKLSSKEIHEYLNEHGIPYSRSTTCLATRIPTNTPLTEEKIERIRSCEDYITENTSCEIVKVRDNGKFGICEVDNIDGFLENREISSNLKSRGFKNVALNLTPIDDDEFIEIDYADGSFEYQLPFKINIENTLNKLDNVIFSNNDEIKLENINIKSNGLISGCGFGTYDEALYDLMDVLSRIRREIA